MWGNKNIKRKVMRVINDRIDRAQKRYDEQEKELHAKHRIEIVALKENLMRSKDILTDDLVKDVFNVR